MKRNYWEIYWPDAGYAHDTIPRLFKWVCSCIRSNYGSPLVDCYDKFGPTEVKYDTKFHPGETWRDYQKITFNIRRLRELDERSATPHYCVAKVVVIRPAHSSAAKIFVTRVYKGRVCAKEYQPIPPQEYHVFDVYAA